MIKAVIFDIGQVLLRFEPEEILKEDFPNADDRRLLAPIVFSRTYWDKLDDGSVNENEVYEALAPTLPEKYRMGVKNTLEQWCVRLPEVEGMKALLQSLTRLSVPVFAISNISRQFALAEPNIPILQYTADRIYSAEVGAIKPSAEIFSIACQRFGYKKEECVFIDDSQKNIDGAKSFGLNTILFDGNSAALKSRLSDMLKLHL